MLSVVERAVIVSIADGLSGISTTKVGEVYVKKAVRSMESWSKRYFLILADEKTEVVLITNHRKNTVKVEVDGYTLLLQAVQCKLT